MIHTPSESFEAHDNVASIFAEPDAASITIPDAHLLFTADFNRKGSDLVLTGDDGHKVLVADYFRHEKQPDLVSPEGALLSASLVELLAGSVAPGQYAQDAQAAAPAGQQPIGRVETVSGSATVTRNGVAVDLNVGDLVFQGDVVQTRSDSTLGIGFADGSAFSLKENARMALNEFVYDPNSTSNSALINLVQGTVSFIASQVAKTGNMRVETPTATLGIRGTFVTVDVSSVDGHTVASLGLETNLQTGEQYAGAFTLTNRITGNQVNVNNVNSMFSVSPNGSIGESAKPPAIAAIEQASFQALSAIAAATAASMGTAPTGPTGPNLNMNANPDGPSGTKAGDTGSNGPASGGSSGASTAPTNTSVDNHQTVQLTAPTTPSDTPPANSGGPGTTPTNPNTTPPTPATTPTNTSPHITPIGTVTNVIESEAATHQIGTFSLLEHVSITNPGPSTNYVSNSAIAVTATYPGGLPSTLTDPAFLSSLLSIGPDGTVSYDKSNFAFLAAGQSLTYAIVFDVQSGSDTLHLTLTLTVNGADGAPTIIIGPGDSTAATVIDDTHATDLVTHGTLSFKDPDATDQHSVSVAVKSGHAIGSFLAGVLVDTTGSDPATGATGDIGWVFAANKPYVQSLAAGETDTEVVTITLSDGNGGTVSEDVSITVVGVNDAPTIAAGSTTPTGAFPELANKTNDTADKDQASGTIAFADPDLSDTHSVMQAAPTFTWSGGVLTAAQQSALTAASTLTLIKADSTGTGAGSIAWTYKIADNALDFLATGEKLTATYNVTINDGHGGTVTQPVTVTMTGTNDAPVINGGPITASVQEDGGTATRATGQLTATDPDLTDTQTWSIVGASATHTPNYQFKIDEFKIVKNSGVFFDDTFSDNNPPPSAPTGFGTITSYSVTGTLSEQDGKAILTGSNAGFGTGSPSGDPFFGEYATLNTNIDPTNTSLGLKDNSNFTVSGLFDLTLPQDDRNGYGIRLTDRTSSQAGDSTVELRVARDSGGIERVQLREIDFSSHTTTVLETITLNPGSHDQILLALTNDVAHPGVVHASFELEQSGVLDSSTLTNFTATGTIFNNEAWTRAQFFAEAPEQSDSILQGTYGQLDITQAGAWTYQLANGQANVQALAAGQTVQDTFTAKVADGHGGYDTKTITVNVTGTNDAPTIVAGSTTATGAITETQETGNETTSGTIAFKDVDLSDTHTVCQAAPCFTWSGGDLSNGQKAALTAASTLSLTETDSTHSGTGSVAWTYTISDSALDFLSPGETLTATYNVTIDDGHGGTAIEPVTVTMTGLTPTLSVTVSGTAQEGSTLTANTTTNDPDATIHYQWQKSADNFQTTTDIGTDSSTYVLQEADEGFKIQVVATASDPDNSSTASATSAATSAVTDITLAFTSAASITGTAQEGQTLTAVNGTLNDGDAAVTGYQWQSSSDGGTTWTNISSATSQTYVVQEADETHLIRVQETATDSDGGPSVISNSAATSAVADITLAQSGVSISGTAQEGQTLTANGTVNDGDATISYRWQSSSDGTHWCDISGATSATYLVQGSDEGFQIRVVETASDTDNNGFTTSVTSAATATVIDATPSITVSISGTAEQGHTLHAVVSGFEDDDTLGYQWQSSSDGGHTWTDIGDATSAYYEVQEADDGHQLQIVVTDTTEDDSGTATATAAVSVGGLQDDWNTAASGSWGTAANWSNGVPTSSIDALINATGAAYTVSLVSAAVANSLVIDSSNATLAAGSDESLAITGALTVDTGNISLTGGTIQAGSIDLESAATLIGFGDVSGPITNSGLIEAQSSHTLAISGDISGTGSIEVLNHATLEVDGSVAATQTLTFAGGTGVTGTLALDHSLTQSFSAVISGLGLSDFIDLKDLTFTTSGDMTATTSFSSASGHTTLVVTQISTAQHVSFTLAGDYTSSTWNFAQDSGTGTIFHDPPATDTGATTASGSASTDLAQTVTAAQNVQGATLDQFTFQSDDHSGTLAVDPTPVASVDPSATEVVTPDTTSSTPSDHQSTAPATAAAGAGPVSTVAATQPTADTANTGMQAGATTQTAVAPAVIGPNGSDTFVFAANFGHEAITNFHPDTDVIEIDHTVFADFQALLAATHDDGQGNAVIAANPNDTITVKNVTVAQLVQHQSDFHFT